MIIEPKQTAHSSSDVLLDEVEEKMSHNDTLQRCFTHVQYYSILLENFLVASVLVLKGESL